MKLSEYEQSILNSEIGCVAERLAMEIVVESAKILGADDLTVISSGHVDGCLYHGDSGVLFCEELARCGARVAVPTSTNVGAVNLLKGNQARLPPEQKKMAVRLMRAHEEMGCTSSWTCAPYQVGSRPALGDQIAWGESNAVAFANSVLGARTNRYGDFLDIACAIVGRAPNYGLHKTENRVASLVIDVEQLTSETKSEDSFYPLLGSLVGRLVGEEICVVVGIKDNASDDQLKALCAGAASTGSVGLLHIAGVTPEARTLEDALHGQAPTEIIEIEECQLANEKKKLSSVSEGKIDCVAFGSPHFSKSECMRVLAVAQQRIFAVPVFICTNRYVMDELKADGIFELLKNLGVEFVVDTCVVVTPILPQKGEVMMTNSAKFAHYAESNADYMPVFGSFRECIESACTGIVTWD